VDREPSRRPSTPDWPRVARPQREIRCTTPQVPPPERALRAADDFDPIEDPRCRGQASAAAETILRHAVNKHERGRLAARGNTDVSEPSGPD
jgi:hypothetical protein